MAMKRNLKEPEGDEMTLDWSVNSAYPQIGRALKYWNAKRTGRSMPTRDDIVASEIRDILPIVQLYDLRPDGSAYRARLIGTKIASFFASDPTGQEFDASSGHPLVTRMLAVLSAVAGERKPLIARVNRSSIDKISFSPIESIYLPLSDNGSDVNVVFAATAVPSFFDTE